MTRQFTVAKLIAGGAEFRLRTGKGVRNRLSVIRRFFLHILLKNFTKSRHYGDPVKHGYVMKWGAWPYSSFHWYLQCKGREWLMELWREYPVLNYEEKWDV